MRKLILLCTSLFAMVLLFSASPVRAQNVDWASAVGDDANPCSFTTPCKTFQGTFNKGSLSQINCEGPGSYGSITTSLIIDCGEGNIGGINSSSASAITVNTTAAATITLRHLALNGLGGATGSGINATSFFSGTLIVENCTIQGWKWNYL